MDASAIFTDDIWTNGFYLTNILIPYTNYFQCDNLLRFNSAGVLDVFPPSFLVNSRRKSKPSMSLADIVKGHLGADMCEILWRRNGLPDYKENIGLCI